MKHDKPTITMHILPVSAIKPDLLDIDLKNTALIVCSDDNNPFIKMFPYRLIIPFIDTTIKDRIGSITRRQAKELLDFWDNRPSDVTDLYICCTEGVSRSPAVAAAILRMSEKSDNPIWNNPYYSPNTLVYQTLCREAGVFAPSWYLWMLKTNSIFRYKISKARGNTGKYERWQIIEFQKSKGQK